MSKHPVITLIAGTEQTRLALLKQVREFIPKERMVISYAIDEGLPRFFSEGLMILSSEVVLRELKAMGRNLDESQLIVAKRRINYEEIGKILRIPKDSLVLFVNDIEETAVESIESLINLGLDEFHYLPYYPGIRWNDERKPKIAITPGEVTKVPDFVETVYDIGPRELDFTTITEILKRLDLLDEKGEELSNKYLGKIISMSKQIAEYSNNLMRLNEHLNSVIDGLNEGLLVYDEEGRISVLNEHLQKMMGFSKEACEGKRIKDVFYDKALISYLMDTKYPAEKILTLKDGEFVIKKMDLHGKDSYVATFKNVKEVIDSNDQLKRELIKKGHYAKYTFEDIIGGSERLLRAKDIVSKLSKTDLTILIKGESGTGKELFASAIHRASKRREKPFLAANFSALPDDLIESELFGYEDGAFTGAKKGGKIGLFQQAEGGTIFLDEIGDISVKLQARLLRVLQEKEIMPLGGHQIRPVDVRVIAATNRNLVRMVQEGTFRQDLYYRLKMGYVSIPALRERKEDIRELMTYFVGVETKETIDIKEEVIDYLMDYDWPGNVRELKNTLEYMLAIREGNTLELKDIPDGGFFMVEGESFMEGNRQEEDPRFKEGLKDLLFREKGSEIKGAIAHNRGEMEDKGDSKSHLKKLKTPPRKEEIEILKRIYERMEKGELVGREVLSKDLKESEYPLTPGQVRTKLNRLEEMGLIIKKRGKHGTVLTEKALSYLD